MLLKYLIIGIILKLTSAIDLQGLSTGKKERNSKNIIKTTSPTIKATSDPLSISTYRVNASNGATCILIRTDALLTIQYRDKLNEDQEADIYLPDYPDLFGDCTQSDISSITLGFKDFLLKILFKKTPGGELWYVKNMELTYSTSNSKFLHIDRPGLNVKLSTKESTLLFPTPIGKSYSCDQEIVVTMFSQDQNDKSGHTAKLLLRELKMQSFMYKAANTWGPTFQCSATGTYRDETAPVAVGSTLAVVVLCSVTGYGIWRYMKVKKVQYGSME